MSARRYRSKPDHVVVAVKLDLDTEGFTYTKWGERQRCKAGDYLVDNQGEIYTVEGAVFVRTYRPIALGQYVKTTPVWATQAESAGSVATKEGLTHYEEGDYLIFNDEAGSDRYAIARAKFEAMYEPDPA